MEQDPETPRGPRVVAKRNDGCLEDSVETPHTPIGTSIDVATLAVAGNRPVLTFAYPRLLAGRLRSLVAEMNDGPIRSTGRRNPRDNR